MKPTVFFSHSSLDRDRIKPIKEHILDKTGNTIQIFMSSDGASIPFVMGDVRAERALIKIVREDFRAKRAKKQLMHVLHERPPRLFSKNG